jgi:branched-chain amino acid aminotransferase
MDIKITQRDQSKRSSVDFDNLAFGNQFSDHMLVCKFTGGEWESPAIIPYGKIQYDPAMSVLHYGQGVFEGMKAFSYKDGKVNIFRPESHYERFVESCERVQIPAIPKEVFLDGLDKLVDLDRDWVPADKFKSLYIRPFAFATDEFLGLKSSDTFSFIIITGPVGNYYKEGIKPVKLTTMPDYVRAVKGGVGAAKVPGNYAASLYPTTKAKEQGYTQVLWLDAVERKYVEEVGTSNIFFVFENEIVTPPLGGSILPGITRRSMIQLARDKGHTVNERKITINEVFEASKDGSLKEIFATGTAAVLSPVGSIHHQGEEIVVDRDKMGPISEDLYTTLTGIHHGENDDEHDWCHVI